MINKIYKQVAKEPTKNATMVENGFLQCYYRLKTWFLVIDIAGKLTTISFLTPCISKTVRLRTHLNRNFILRINQKITPFKESRLERVS